LKATEKKRLERAGWRVGTVEEFLDLSPEEAELVEMKLALGDLLKRRRLRKRLTQVALARKLGSSQSRIAKLELGVRGATLDLLFRALLAAGVTTDEIARAMRHKKRSAA
jgi:plasmid maintenance system antidote protein VapI